LGTTKYNGAYKGEVIASLKQAMSGLKSCKSVSIDIPSDFEAAGTLRNALDTLKGIDIKGAVSEIKSASADFERAESAVEASILDFSNLFGSYIGANTSSKANNYSLKNTQKSGTMYELDHLTNKQKEKINQGVKEASKENGAFRTIASIVNGLVSIFKGGYKMGENIGDFIALRTERLQENHLRTIYTSNAEYEKAYREQYEKNIEKMRKKTMSYVAKDHTEATFNKLYEENDTLKEIDEKAYSPFKTTGVAYKIGEQVAPAIVATGAMVVAPEAAPTIVPIIIEMNSGGRASEEYLHDKKMNSREGIEQAYKDGEITKEEYDSYKYIWNLSADEFRIAMNDMENQEDRDRLFQTYFMSDKWTKEENRDEAITYGNAVGAWDAAQYALGMNLFKFNSTNSALLNSSMRVGGDTGLNASDTPFKASVRSLIDQDTDFDTEFEKLGGWNAVGISAALGFAGSVLGELGTNLKAGKEANQIYKVQGVDADELDWYLKDSLNADIISGKISLQDANAEDFLLNYSIDNGSIKTQNYLIDKQINKIAEIQNWNEDNIEQGLRDWLRHEIRKKNISLEDVKNDKSFLVNYAEKNNIDYLLPADVKINVAKNRINNFLKEHGILWMKRGKEAIDNIRVFKTKKDFEDFLINEIGYTLEETDSMVGVNIERGKTIVLSNDSYISDIIHEGDHSIGNVRIDNENIAETAYNYYDVVKNKEEVFEPQRGINEAFTESITLRMDLKTGLGSSIYSDNVSCLNQMIDLLNENGYEDIDLYSYFGKDKTLFAKTVNKIMDDDNFYKQIARDMNIADGREKFYSSADIEAARLDLSCLLDRFKDRITSLKKG